MTGNTLLSGIREKNTSGSSNNTSSSSLSFAIKVTGFENEEYFVGNRLDTGEEVKVSLRDIANQNSDKDKQRPEIKDYMNKRSKRYIDVGSAVVQFDQIYHTKDNVYSAKWPNVITKNKKYATPACLYSSVEFVDANSTYVKVRVLRADKAEVKDNIQDFDNLLMGCLTPRFPYHKPFAVIRLIEKNANNEVVDVVALTVAPKYEQIALDDDLTEWRPCSPEESMDQFRERHCSGDSSLYNYIGHNSVVVEIIPGTVFRAGPDTNQKLVKMPEGILKPFKASYKINRDELDTRDNLGYVLTNIGIKKSENTDGYFLSFVKPNDFSSQALELKDVPTANYNGG